MEIRITEKAQQYLKEQNKKHIIFVYYEQFCWGGRVNRTVEVSTIENFIRDTYMKYEVDDFEVYIDPRLNFEGDEIIIDLENFFFLKRLTQKGLSI